MSEDNSEADELMLEISKTEMDNNDGVMKTKITVNTVTGRTYTIMSAVSRRVMVTTLVKRVTNKLPIVFPIPSSSVPGKVMDLIIPTYLHVQDIGVEDHSNLEVAQKPRLRQSQ